ncbi:MAG: ATP-dependent zinc protease [Crocosphaera sp.]|nr:ATP-dependent zinc protease [Crocosphaera sp.]
MERQPKHQEKYPSLIIGWREWLDLPDLDITGIKAKIDTGARSSALHAFDIKEMDKNGKKMVRFQVHPYQKDTETTINCEAELLEWRDVKDSGGHKQNRPAILTTVKVEGQIWKIELTLTNREVMGFRMLLGREAVCKRFLVDPGASYLLSNSKTIKHQQKAYS